MSRPLSSRRWLQFRLRSLLLLGLLVAIALSGWQYWRQTRHMWRLQWAIGEYLPPDSEEAKLLKSLSWDRKAWDSGLVDALGGRVHEGTKLERALLWCEGRPIFQWSGSITDETGVAHRVYLFRRRWWNTHEGQFICIVTDDNVRLERWEFTDRRFSGTNFADLQGDVPPAPRIRFSGRRTRSEVRFHYQLTDSPAHLADETLFAPDELITASDESWLKENEWIERRPKGRDMSTISLLLFALLGLLALLLDLGSRLFGTYARTPLRAAVRITIVTAACAALMAPALISFALEEGPSPRGLWLSAALGLVAVLHFLFPFRFGIQKSTGDSPAQVQPLIPRMQIRTETFASELIPAAADSLECLVLSDLHCNTRHKLQLIRRIVDALKTETVDCLFVLGDLGEKNSLIPDVLAAIAQLPHKHGTFLVRSNHDFEGRRDEVVEQTAAQHSIRVLANAAAMLPDLGICLLGLEYPWNQQGTPSPPDGTFTIGLTHTPDNLTHFARLHVPLSIAGHTHGGKIRLPWIGPLLVPSKFGRLLDYGWFRQGESRMFVTKGIGYFPGPFGSQGEVLKLRLMRIP